MRLPLILTLFIFLNHPHVSADVYVKAQIVGMGSSETWTSKDRQRNVVNLPMTGTFITITRLDKGIEWLLSPKQQVYQAKPIAMTYEKAKDRDMRFEVPMEAGMAKRTPEMGLGYEECVPSFTVLNEERTIGGLKAKGIQMSCAGQEATMIMWQAPLKGDIKKIQGEMVSYARAHMEKVYTNFPEEEKGEMVNFASRLGPAFGQTVMPRIRNFGNFPEGMLVAMEVLGDEIAHTDWAGNEVSPYVFEILEVRFQEVETDTYEVPTGYALVQDIHQSMASEMLNQFGLGALGSSQQIPQIPSVPQAQMNIPNGDFNPKAPNVPEMAPFPTAPQPTAYQVPTTTNAAAPANLSEALGQLSSFVENMRTDAYSQIPTSNDTDDLSSEF